MAVETPSIAALRNHSNPCCGSFSKVRCPRRSAANASPASAPFRYHSLAFSRSTGVPVPNS